MPALARRRYPERPDCWHVYYGDVQIGTIAIRPGVPVDVDQWGWQRGFFPPSHNGQHVEGTAETFEQARADFGAAWEEYLPKCTEVDFLGYRRQRAWTAWKYAMQESGCRMPAQNANGRSRCFCGAEIDLKNTEEHVYAAHMAEVQPA
jgi:hypothetical protein